MSEILALIPARGGSKGIPRKNIVDVAGKPLIAWSIETALNCKKIGRVVVSTDDGEIAQISQSYGASVPFLRPAEFAQDDTTDLPVYQHALSWFSEYENYQPDIIVWLRPTTPLRTRQDVETALQLLITTGADWVRSVCSTEHHPYWMKHVAADHRLTPFIDGVDETGYLRRQLLPPVYRLNGVVDVTWAKTIMEQKELYRGDVRGYVMPLERSLDIDNELDLAMVDLLLKMQGENSDPAGTD